MYCFICWGAREKIVCMTLVGYWDQHDSLCVSVFMLLLKIDGRRARDYVCVGFVVGVGILALLFLVGQILDV
jgi:hypothetical protein